MRVCESVVMNIGTTGGYPPCVCTETAVRFSFFKNPKC